jgi:NhaP-type Na+/H+ or K+/H+ antiporter
VAAGVVSSVFAIFLSKKLRFMTKDRGVTETGFLFLIGFFTYIYTEMLDFSGSISLLLYGILLNHYNVYNMSEESYRSSVNTFTLLSNISEGMLFLIMGIMVFQGQWECPDSDD